MNTKQVLMYKQQHKQWVFSIKRKVTGITLRINDEMGIIVNLCQGLAETNYTISMATHHRSSGEQSDLM